MSGDDKDKDLVGAIPIFGLASLEEIVNAVEEKIDDLRDHLDDFPGEHGPLNGELYVVWERRAMIKIGIVQGWTAALSAARLLPFDLGEKLKHRALGIINRATAKVQMGNRKA